MRNDGSVTTSPRSSRDLVSAPQTTNLADLLERVLDKGIVIAGDITLSLGTVEVLTLKIRLLIASVDKAQQIGINWWQSDPFLSSRARELEEERNLLKERLERLERRLLAPTQEADREHVAAGQRSNAAAAYVLDPEGRMIAELKQLAHRPLQQLQEDVRPQALERAAQRPEDEQPQAPERASRPEAAQAEQPAGGRPPVELPKMTRRFSLPAMPLRMGNRPVSSPARLGVQTQAAT